MPGQTEAAGVEALFFDVFGTLVDWRTSIAREAERILAPLGYRLDWLAFADAWRGEYQPGMEEVRSGRIPFRQARRAAPAQSRALPAALRSDRPVRRRVARPQPGLAPARRLAGRAGGAGAAQAQIHASRRCSNGNIALMVDLARRNDLPWDAILGSEIAGDYKPKPRVYLARLRGARSCAGAMHDGGGALERPQGRRGSCGLRTGAHRAAERVWPEHRRAAPTVPVDYAAQDLAELADKLGAEIPCPG